MKKKQFGDLEEKEDIGEIGEKGMDVTFSSKFSNFEKEKAGKEVKIQRKKNRILAKSINAGRKKGFRTNFTIEEADLGAYSGDFQGENIGPQTTKSQKLNNNSVGNIPRPKFVEKNSLFKVPIAVSQLSNFREIDKGKLESYV